LGFVLRPTDETVLHPFSPVDSVAPTDCALLLSLQHQALTYFLDNQTPGGLILDRQSNRGPRRPRGVCSLAATGMGLIALALAAGPPYRLLTPSDARQRVRLALRTAIEQLPHDRGVVPHFVDSRTGAVVGFDARSTVETAWLVAGSLWSAHYLHDAELEILAARLADRVDWRYWTVPETPGGRGLIRHGKSSNGKFLPCSWDRLNGETVFLYVLAAGAAEDKALGPSAWAALETFHGVVAGHRFNNADLGLFVFQYGLDLLDLRTHRPPHAVDLAAEATIAARANRAACRAVAHRYRTYRHYWGLSAGDGPGAHPEKDEYRAYSPAGPVDGTAHLTASLASVAHVPGAVVEQFRRVLHEQPSVAGRYGCGNINLDRGWVARDMVGIDAGAVVLALDNFLTGERVRAVFHRLANVRRGLERLGFTRNPTAAPADPEGLEEMRRAS
jgi:hypothetical protein